MCQIVSGNRSDVEDLPITSLPTRRFPRRPNFIGNSKDIMLCPVMSKISFPPGSGATRKVADSFPPSPVNFPTSSNEEEHSCVICSHFAEEADAGNKQPQNAEVTLENVFKYVCTTGLTVIDSFRRRFILYAISIVDAQGTPPLHSASPLAYHVCGHSLGYVVLPS